MSDPAFEKSVLNWLSEATSVLASLLEREGMSGSKILADACERCWAGFPAASGGPDPETRGGRDSRNAKVPVAYAVVDRDDDTVYAISMTEGTRNWPNSKCVPLYRN